MNSSQLFFFTVFLLCYVNSKRTESERSLPEYEPILEGTHSSEEPIGTASANRADTRPDNRPTLDASDENQEYVPKEEELKPNKKDKHYGHTSDPKGYKNSKKFTNGETSADNVYKDYKNSNKKSNGKQYNKKYSKQNQDQKMSHDELAMDFASDEQPPHESIHKRYSPSPKASDSVAHDRVERSANFESEPIIEEQPQEVKYQKQEKNRKSEYKNGKNGKYGKQSKKSKNGSKRQKRSYFGFWA